MMKLRDRIIAGERAAIAKAITLVESSREEDIIQSHELKIGRASCRERV